MQNAIDVYNMLSDIFRGKWNVGLMHGKLHSDEKDQVMREFEFSHDLVFFIGMQLSMHKADIPFSPKNIRKHIVHVNGVLHIKLV